MPGKTFIEKQQQKNAPYIRGLRFIKFGEFSKQTLIWHTPQEGYFITNFQGRQLGTLNQRIPQETVEMLAYASK